MQKKLTQQVFKESNTWKFIIEYLQRISVGEVAA
jgi:hypothetical protein